MAGKWRGRRLQAPADDRVRPTADRVREAWMSIISADLDDARVLDLFAGSGALGLEALSRGASSVAFVEIGARSIRALRTNATALGAGEEITIHKVDAQRFIQRLEAGAFDVAFADPPYHMELARIVAERWLEVPFARVIGIEHEKAAVMPGAPDRRTYGDTVVSFYRSP